METMDNKSKNICVENQREIIEIDSITNEDLQELRGGIFAVYNKKEEEKDGDGNAFICCIGR